MGRGSRSMFIAGIVGAAAGMWIMNMINGSNNRMMLRTNGKRLMANARRGMYKLGEAGRAALQEGMEVLRQ